MSEEKQYGGTTHYEDLKRDLKKTISSSQGCEKPDMVNRPPHYTMGKIEVISFIEDQKFGYHLGNAIKYIARSAHKGSEVEDLKKAIWYIQRRIDNLTAEAFEQLQKGLRR